MLTGTKATLKSLKFSSHSSVHFELQSIFLQDVTLMEKAIQSKKKKLFTHLEFGLQMESKFKGQIVSCLLQFYFLTFAWPITHVIQKQCTFPTLTKMCTKLMLELKLPSNQAKKSPSGKSKMHSNCIPNASIMHPTYIPYAVLKYS